ncbi:MAG: acyl-CoA dehydrogenase [Lautropia sp.]
MSADRDDAFADSADAWLRARDHRERVRALDDAGGGFDRAVWREIGALGWFGILVAERDAGLGLGIAEVASVARMAGRHLLPEPFVDAGVHPIALLARLPAHDARERLLAALIDGTAVAGVAWQEHAGHLVADRIDGVACEWSGTDAGDGTVARVHGRKCFVRPGTDVDGWIVSARAHGEPALLWVAADADGVSVQRDRGVDAGVVATLRLERSPCTVIARGDVAACALQAATALATLAQAAELLGVARRAHELTCEHLRTREQFGRPIGSFQALQHRMVDAMMQLELADACVRDCVRIATRWQASGMQGDTTALQSAASRAKARCAHAALETTRTAIHLHGAIGTTNEHDVGLYFKRALMLASRWGNAVAHRARYAALADRPATARGTAAGRSPACPPEQHATPLDAATPGATPHAAPHDDAPHDDALLDDAPLDPARCRDVDWDTIGEARFRRTVRALFAAHYPEARRHLPYRQTWSESKAWYLTLSRLGWLAPAWPKAHGGMGLPPDKLIAWIEESEAWGVARVPDQGLVMVGPILMRFGTPAQRARFLPPILAGEHVWTQGYSEPGAGSDLAAVRTEAIATRDAGGDCFIVNGQKTWTTWGADGTHMFMLVRTDKTVKKQAGISFLLVDLRTPGVTVRPIRNIAGETDFCEVFFDDVRVPRENLVGELNQGWTIAKALLGFERLFTGSPKHSQHTLHQVEMLARARGLHADPAFRARLVELALDTADLTAAYTGFAEIAKRGDPIPPSISLLKIWSTETWERLALLLVDAAQDLAGLRDACRVDGAGAAEGIDLHVVAPLFNVIGAKIFAGSNEIQRNIVARSVLDLPG